MKKRRVPLRKCLGCGDNKNKKELVRIVKTPDNEILIDISGKINGRGAYICNRKDCFSKAVVENKIARSLRVEIPKEKIEELEKEIKDN